MQHRPLSPEILEITLPKPWDFLPGQYVLIEHEGQSYPFSIASAPFESVLRFHVQHSARRPMDASLWQRLQENHPLTLSLPQGQAYLREDSKRPLLFIAGGSGFAPIHSMLATLAWQGSTRSIRLYWGVQEPDFLYALDEIKAWQTHLKNFQWIPVLSQPSPSWTGRTGLVHQAVLEDALDLTQYDIYLAGPFALSKTAQLDFTARYGPNLHLYSDAL